MSSKTDTEVIIGGKIFTLSGYESEEYLQKVASYINNKVEEYGKIDSFRRQPMDTQSVLLQLNIADDYFKAKKQISLLEEELQTKEKELYDLKHELIAAQIKLESTDKRVKEMQTEINENGNAEQTKSEESGSASGQTKSEQVDFAQMYDMLTERDNTIKELKATVAELKKSNTNLMLKVNASASAGDPIKNPYEKFVDSMVDR